MIFDLASNRVASCVLFVLTGASFAACGQTAPPDADADDTPSDDTLGDGGTDDADAAPDDTPANPLNYYPLSDGASWTYRHSSNGGWNETISVAQKKVDGKVVYVVEDTPDPNGEHTVSTLVLNGTAAVRTDKEVYLEVAGKPELQYSVNYGSGFVRFDSSWPTQKPGFKETRDYVRVETDVGMPPSPPGDRSHIYHVESVNETVVTEAGTFRNCVRVRRERNWVSPDPTASEEQDKLFFFAPGVGKVKEENLTKGSTEVLIKYTIPE